MQRLNLLCQLVLLIASLCKGHALDEQCNNNTRHIHHKKKARATTANDDGTNSNNICTLRKIYNFERSLGGIPNDKTKTALLHNTGVLTDFLTHNASGSTLHFDNTTYHFNPGVHGTHIVDFRMYINGTLEFHRPKVTQVAHSDMITHANDEREMSRPWPCILIEHSSDLIFSSPDPANDVSSHNNNYDGVEKEGIGAELYDEQYGKKNRGVIAGNGAQYWGIPVVGYVQLMEFRPDLFLLQNATNVVLEYLTFKDAPRWTLNLQAHDMIVRYVSVVARRTYGDGHSFLDLTAFNSDGIDLHGSNVHVHDVDIWNQDDCVCVKDRSSNMLLERIHASGVGLTVGSIGHSTVSNITFRNSLLYRSFKGIYISSEWQKNGPGLIENVLYENITIFEPVQWGLWIGPAQQVDNEHPLGYPCNTQLCSLCWPMLPFAKCLGSKNSRYRNITLRDINIINPLQSPGVIIGSDSAPVEGIVFDNVVVSGKNTPEAIFYQNMDRHELFPGLAYPIHDHYVSPFMLGFYVICILATAALVVLALLWCLGGKRSGYSRIDGKGDNKTKSLRFVLGSIVILAATHSLVIANGTLNKNHYFVCEGVVGGAATGNTRPVPSCFRDETRRRRTWELQL